MTSRPLVPCRMCSGASQCVNASTQQSRCHTRLYAAPDRRGLQPSSSRRRCPLTLSYARRRLFQICCPARRSQLPLLPPHRLKCAKSCLDLIDLLADLGQPRLQKGLLSPLRTRSASREWHASVLGLQSVFDQSKLHQLLLQRSHRLIASSREVVIHCIGQEIGMARRRSGRQRRRRRWARRRRNDSDGGSETCIGCQ